MFATDLAMRCLDGNPQLLIRLFRCAHRCRPVQSRRSATYVGPASTFCALFQCALVNVYIGHDGRSQILIYTKVFCAIASPLLKAAAKVVIPFGFAGLSMVTPDVCCARVGRQKSPASSLLHLPFQSNFILVSAHHPYHAAAIENDSRASRHTPQGIYA